MDFQTIASTSLLTALILFGILLLAKTWLIERVKLAFQKDHTEFLNELQWDRKIKEQAEKVAEYLSFARALREDSSNEDYIKANRLSWELAMWLPEDIYNATVQAIVNPGDDINPLSVIISVRKLLLKEKAGVLSHNNVAYHAPGIGQRQKR